MSKQELYNQAKEAYYNGEPIMTDLEFDELEKDLGLENQGYIGSTKGKYTIPHPFIMGSLSKVQIKEDDNHNIDWEKYSDQVMSYLNKSKKDYPNFWYFETSPKYDGCSFEVVIDNTGNLVSVSTRGNGNSGVDIKVWFEDEWKHNFKPTLSEYLEHNKGDFSYLVVRGECLVKSSVFNEKYSKDFTMPRSFVAGVLGQDWEGTDKQKEMRKDLSWVCYDYRLKYPNGILEELDYYDEDQEFYNPATHLPGEKGGVTKHTMLDLSGLYGVYDTIRKYHCEYALDGFVIKPGVQFRLQDGGRARQEDCVAVKFLPEIVDAVIKDIEWNVGKTGEYFPTGILEDVILGGKKVNRVSLSNYGKVIEDGLGIGSKVKISLAGDIIPYLYKTESTGESITIPEDSYVDGVHLMKTMTDEEKMYIKFLNSVNVLKPDGIGEAIAEKLFKIYPTENIVDFMVDFDWELSLDDSKSSQNIIKGIIERRKTLSLSNVIQSLGYENCGEKNALWLAKKVSGLNPDTKGIPMTIIDLSEDLYFQDQVEYYMEHLHIKPLEEEKTDGKIPVILTGSPKECGYNTKADFLNSHPEYIETTKFNECKILFTDDLNSTSSKMEKAKKNNIEIRRYE